MNFPSTGAKFSDLVGTFIGLINLIIPVLAGVAILVFFIGLIRYIYGVGAKGHSKGREAIIWGLIGLFVLFTLAGILQVLKTSFLP